MTKEAQEIAVPAITNGGPHSDGPERSFAWRGAARLATALVLAGAACDLAWRLVPNHLSVTTGIVGYPIFYNYDYQRYTYAYYIVAFLLPAVMAAAFYLMARVGPLRRPANRGGKLFPLRTAEPSGSANDTGSNVGKQSRQPTTQHEQRVELGAFWSAARIALPAAAVALEVSVARSTTRGTLTSAAIYAGIGYVVAILAGASAYRLLKIRSNAGNRRQSRRAVSKWRTCLSKTNSLFAIATVPLLYTVSQHTAIRILSTKAVVQYSWLPLWTTVVLTAAALGVWAWMSLGRDRDVEAMMLVGLIGPLLLFLVIARLPGALGPFQAFDDAQSLAGSQLVFIHGLFPWKGVYLLHGILPDLLDGAVGIAMFGNSRWGANAGANIVVTPVTWLMLYVFCVYFFRRNRLALFGIGVAAATGLLQGAIGKFAFVPLMLICFDLVLKRPTWSRCSVFILVLFANAIITPESGVFVACLLLLVPIYELAVRERGTRYREALLRTKRMLLVGGAVVAAWCASLAGIGALGAFIDYYRLFAPSHALWGDYPVQWNLSQNVMVTAQFFFPPLLWLVTVGWVGAKVWLMRKWSYLDWSIVAAAGFAAVYYPQAFGRADVGHALEGFAAAVPLLLLWLAKVLGMVDAKLGDALWKALAGLVRRNSRRFKGAALFGGWFKPRYLGTLVVVGLVVGLTSADIGAPYGSPEKIVSAVPVRYHSTAPSQGVQPYLKRLGYTQPGVIDTDAIKRLGMLLDQYAGKNGPVFTFANELGVTYYLLNRVPGTRVYHVEMAQTAAAQRQVIAELRKSRPAVVLYSDPYFGIPDYDQIPQAVRGYLVSQYILDRYRPIVDLAGELVYLRRGITERTLPPLPPSSETAGLYFATNACSFGDAANFLAVPKSVEARKGTPVGLKPIGAAGVTVSGWAIDPTTKFPAASVLAVQNGAVVAQATPQAPRPDVVASVGNSAALYSGYSVTLPATITGAVEMYAELKTGGVIPLAVDRSVPDAVVKVGAASGAINSNGKTLNVEYSGPAGFADAVVGHRSGRFRVIGAKRGAPSAYRWLEISSKSHLDRASISLSDQVGGAVSHEIQFDVLPRSGRRMYVEVGSCPQWHGYSTIDHLTVSVGAGHSEPLTVRLIR